MMAVLLNRGHAAVSQYPPFPPISQPCGMSADVAASHWRHANPEYSSAVSPDAFNDPSASRRSPLVSAPRAPAMPTVVAGPIVSKRGMLAVYCYTPSEGESRAPITATVELRPPATDTPVRLRIVLGHAALSTRLSDLGAGKLQVSAQALPFEKARFPRHSHVPLTLQAIIGEKEILDSLTFGSFTYWESVVNRDPNEDAYSPPLSLKRPREDDAVSLRPAPVRRSSYTLDNTLPLSVKCESVVQSLSYPPAYPHQTADQQRDVGLVRTTTVAHGSHESDTGEPHRAVLDWAVSSETPHPDSFDKGWSLQDFNNGRRLVRFQRVQEGFTLRVACQAIAQDRYTDQDIVISCIYRPETKNFWFTSVDIIYLLERLVGNLFSVEEKNRIRRNLEGFKPTTVSKNRPGFESFFQRIMDFPAPKPRNIEKDVKVFHWSVLSQALYKIISKYSLFVYRTPVRRVALLPNNPNNSPSISTRDIKPPVSPHSEQHFYAQSSQSPYPPSPLPSPYHVNQDLEQHLPGLTYPEPSSDEVSVEWRERVGSLPTNSDYSQSLGADIGCCESPASIPCNAFSSAFMSNVGPYVTLSEVSLGPGGVGTDMDGQFGDIRSLSSSSPLSAMWEVPGSSLADAHLASQPGSGEGGNAHSMSTPHEGLSPIDAYNAPLLELEPVPENEIYAQYSMANQTLFDDIIDHHKSF